MTNRTLSGRPTTVHAPTGNQVGPSLSNAAAPTPTEQPAAARQRAAEGAAWLFYAIAATGSTIGQIWVGVDLPPWPSNLAWWQRALLVLPFAVVVDLGGVVTAAFGDARQRLGEPAYGWQILSAASVCVGVGINIVGHRHTPYLAVVFGGLGVFAYTVWLLHAAARRRDALRAAGKLADTAPHYGLAQWRREPAVTRRAQALALEYGYGLHQSLTIARQQLRDEQRTTAVARHVETLIRARHQDPVLAAIAATTLDIDAVSAALTAQADITGWAAAIGSQLTPPTTATDSAPGTIHNRQTGGGWPVPPADVLRRVPTKQAEYDRWRRLWAQLAADPNVDNRAFADRHRISVRQVQWIRAVSGTGLLDSPMPPVARLVQLAQHQRSTSRPSQTPAG